MDVRGRPDTERRAWWLPTQRAARCRATLGIQRSGCGRALSGRSRGGPPPGKLGARHDVGHRIKSSTAMAEGKDRLSAINKAHGLAPRRPRLAPMTGRRRQPGIRDRAERADHGASIREGEESRNNLKDEGNYSFALWRPGRLPFFSFGLLSEGASPASERSVPIRRIRSDPYPHSRSPAEPSRERRAANPAAVMPCLSRISDRCAPGHLATRTSHSARHTPRLPPRPPDGR